MKFQKNGGTRIINAPSSDLKLIQENLSKLLQDCIEEISEINGLPNKVSHGFRRDRSIITNAKAHRNRRYVFNVDIKDFFGSINFGRVYGFFLKDQNFSLDKRVAAVLGKIACHEDALPQGSPCSPVISNLIAHIMDLHLVRLAKRHGCTYTRYADDLTFSTNNSEFPKEIAVKVDSNSHNWVPGKELVGLVKKSRFELNNSKTRMQYRDSRQEVTGLIVNKKVNVRNEYRRKIRAMVHRLFTTGTFHLEHSAIDATGGKVKTSIEGKADQLHGMLGFIDGVDQYNKSLVERNGSLYAKKETTKSLTTKETMYRRFLMYKEFYAADRPVIVCEGNTDNIYLTHAIRSLAAKYPLLAEIDSGSKIKIKVRLFKYTDTSTGRILGMRGGYGSLKNFLLEYNSEQGRFKAPGKLQPVIVLYDNDDAAGPIRSVISKITNTKLLNTEPFFHVVGNLYAMPTPLLEGAASSCIENFFDAETLKEEVDGKFFDYSETADKTTSYGKVVFAHKVVVPKAATINFSGFNSLLSNLSDLIEQHPKKFPAA